MDSDALFGEVVSVMNRAMLAAIAAILLTPWSAAAQIDLSGSWAARQYGDALSNQPGPEPTPVDYLGLPLNEAGRLRALTYSYSQISSADRVCAFYSPIYMMLGPFGLKMWNETEPLNGSTIAWHIGGWEDLAPLTIWMDGRPHPSRNAPHEMSGFTTGVWEDDALVAYTTHMKASILRRNGVPTSDRSTMRTRFVRHGDLLTVTARIEDPVYLSEPVYLTRIFQLSGGAVIRAAGQPCVQGDEGVPEGTVSHYLPGKNPFVDEMTRLYNLPQEAVLGGRETMYPEFLERLRGIYTVPQKCPRACGGPGTYAPVRQN
jgi:hypothetical protein